MHIVEGVSNMNALCCVSTIYGHGRKKVFDMLLSLYALKKVHAFFEYFPLAAF